MYKYQVTVIVLLSTVCDHIIKWEWASFNFGSSISYLPLLNYCNNYRICWKGYQGAESLIGIGKETNKTMVSHNMFPDWLLGCNTVAQASVNMLVLLFLTQHTLRFSQKVVSGFADPSFDTNFKPHKSLARSGSCKETKL